MIKGTLIYRLSDSALVTRALNPGKIMPLWKAALGASVAGAFLGSMIGGLVEQAFPDFLIEHSLRLWGAIIGQVICVTLGGWHLVRRGESQQVLGEPQALSLDETGVRLETEHAESFFGWPAIERVIRIDGQLVLGLKNRSYMVLHPGDFTTPSDWNAACALVAEKLGPRLQG